MLGVVLAMGAFVLFAFLTLMVACGLFLFIGRDKIRPPWWDWDFERKSNESKDGKNEDKSP